MRGNSQAHHPLVRVTTASLKFVLLDRLLGKGRCVLSVCRLSFGSDIHWRMPRSP
jgi:hypothetical protein